jgi:hypothetical protein
VKYIGLCKYAAIFLLGGAAAIGSVRVFFFFHPPYPICGTGQVLKYEQGEKDGNIITNQVTKQGDTLMQCVTLSPKLRFMSI